MITQEKRDFFESEAYKINGDFGYLYREELKKIESQGQVDYGRLFSLLKYKEGMPFERKSFI